MLLASSFFLLGIGSSVLGNGLAEICLGFA